MAELLTSLDVVNQSFKKSMRGYDPAEVDEFLDGVAETLQVYAQKNKEMARELEARAENLAEYDKTRSILHEALLIAQKSADEKVRKAEIEAERIVAEAIERADDMCGEAAREAERLRDGVAQIRNVRVLYEQEFRGVLAKFDNMLNQAMTNSTVKSAVDAILGDGGMLEEPASETETEIAEAEECDLEQEAQPPPPREITQDLREAFEALGVDPRIVMDDPELRRVD